MSASLISSQPTFAEPTPGNWARCANRADKIREFLEHPNVTGNPVKEVRTACDGTSSMFMTGDYPK